MTVELTVSNEVGAGAGDKSVVGEVTRLQEGSVGMLRLYEVWPQPCTAAELNNVGFVNGWFYRCGLEPVQVGERGRKGVFIGIIFTLRYN